MDVETTRSASCDSLGFRILFRVDSSESWRALDCLRLAKTMSRRRLAEFRDDADRNLAQMNLLPIDQHVLKRAGESFPTPLKTLDAVHLATALFLNDDLGGGIVLLTHDRQLGVAALACGLTVYRVLTRIRDFARQW